MKNRVLGPGLISAAILILVLHPVLGSVATPAPNEKSSMDTPEKIQASADGLRGEVNDLRPRFDMMKAALVAPVPPGSGSRRRLDEAYGKLPLSFEGNQGQTNSQVKFLVRGSGSSLFLTPTEAVFVLTTREAGAKEDASLPRRRTLTRPEKVSQTVVRMKLVGANQAPKLEGIEQLAGKVNYLVGNDPAKWLTNVPTYAKVRYENVYRGIDLIYYGDQGQLEYDFVVGPGADPNRIALSFRGANRIEVDARGDLVLHTAVGTVRQRRPFIYQQVAGARREISGRYVLKGGDRVGFQIAAYDANRSLVIDPGVFYSTYLGGSGGDAAWGIAVDSAGNAYVIGTASADFPTTSGVFQNNGTVFVTKLNPTGSGLVYSTHFGGSNYEFPKGIAVDNAGNAYVTGVTASTDYPTTAGAFQPGPPASIFAGVGFVTKLAPSGSALVYSTYLAGNNTSNSAGGIAVDTNGSAYVTGTSGSDFPTTSGAFQTTFGGRLDAFVAKLDPTGSSLVYSTFLGGSQSDHAVADTTGTAIAVDTAGNAYLTGATNTSNFPITPGAFQTATSNSIGLLAFVTKLNPAGSALVYSTYLGGGPVPGGGSLTSGNGIALDSAGNAYVMGITNASDFPTTPGAFQTVFRGGTDIFVTKLDTIGSTLIYSTFLGGSSYDGSQNSGGIAADPSGNAYVGSVTSSDDFPTTADAFQTALSFNNSAATLTILGPDGSLAYSTYFGGSGGSSIIAIAAGAAGNAYVAGFTNSPDFPTSPGAFQTALGGIGDAFVAMFSANNTRPGSSVSVLAEPRVTVTFATVSSAGNTAGGTSTTGPTPPAGFSVGGSSYYSITTTATFGAPVTICITYDPTQFNDPTTLRVFHFDNTWLDVTTSNDPVGGKICGQTSSLSPFLIAERTPLAVTIDIRPGSYPNSINLGSNGVVPVAIFSTATFDARTVDPSTVTLANAPVKLKGKGQPMASFQDVNGDGRLDLVVNVQTNALELTSGDVAAVLKGRTFSGQPIKGSDSVRIVPQ